MVFCKAIVVLQGLFHRMPDGIASTPENQRAGYHNTRPVRLQGGLLDVAERLVRRKAGLVLPLPFVSMSQDHHDDRSWNTASSITPRYRWYRGIYENANRAL